MPIDARIPLQGEGVNVTPIADALARKVGRERQEGLAVEATSDNPNADEALAKLAVSNPYAARVTQNMIATKNAAEQARFAKMQQLVARDALKLQRMPYQMRNEEIKRRIAEGDPNSPETQEYIDLLNQPEEKQMLVLQDDIDAARSIEDIMKSREGRAGESYKLGATIAVDDGQGGKKLVAGVLNSNTGEFSAEEAAVNGSFISRTTGETGNETTDRAIREAGGTTRAKEQAETDAISGKVTEKGSAQRIQTNIQTGIDMADQLPNVLRSIELLNSVETGGFEGAALRAKDLFGISSADEAELSAGLGKAVVSQLRETFGSAFTAAEGRELKRIEAGIGKSTEGNRRQLNNLRQFIVKKAKRGLEDAKSINDFRAAQQIQDSLNFRLQQNEPGKELNFDLEGNLIQ